MEIQSFVRATSIAEAVHLLAEPEMKSMVLSGGVGITLGLRTGSLECERLVDVSGVEDLKQIEAVDLQGDPFTRIGAGLSLRQLEKNTMLQSIFPLFTGACSKASDPARRNALTLGGRLASRRCPGMVFPVLAALDALVVTQSRTGETVFPVLNWLRDVKPNQNDLITAVLLPRVSLPLWKMEEAKRRQMPGEFVAGVLAAGVISNGKWEDLRITSSVEPFGVQRWTEIEQLAKGQTIDKEVLLSVRNLLDDQLKRLWGEGPEALYQRQVVSGLVWRCIEDLTKEGVR